MRAARCSAADRRRRGSTESRPLGRRLPRSKPVGSRSTLRRWQASWRRERAKHWRFGKNRATVANSWIFAAARLGFELRIAAPRAFQPPAEVLQRAGGKVVCTEDLRAAAAGADVLYTDVWVSMGKEAESAARLEQLSGYQINAALVKLANPGALVMHCLPAYRGKEIDDATFEANAETIFDQAENRLHAQRAVLNWLVS